MITYSLFLNTVHVRQKLYLCDFRHILPDHIFATDTILPSYIEVYIVSVGGSSFVAKSGLFWTDLMFIAPPTSPGYGPGKKILFLGMLWQIYTLKVYCWFQKMHCGKWKGCKIDPKPSHNALKIYSLSNLTIFILEIINSLKNKTKQNKNRVCNIWMGHPICEHWVPPPPPTLWCHHW